MKKTRYYCDDCGKEFNQDTTGCEVSRIGNNTRLDWNRASGYYCSFDCLMCRILATPSSDGGSQ
jgi:hypothetical protein